MPSPGKLTLELVDVYGDRIGERVDIALFNQGLAERKVVRSVDAGRRITITNLQEGVHGLYRIEIDPPSYLPINRFVTIPSGRPGELSLACPVDPGKVVQVEFPAYRGLPETLQSLLTDSNQVQGFGGLAGAPLYGALDDLRKAGMLNIFAKSTRTRFPDGHAVTDYFQTLRELRQDRYFVSVSADLRSETKNSVANGLFRPVPDTLHSPPLGFVGAGSFKTDDRYGNLQLTFWQNGADMVADVDIDDAGGLEHVFQVVRNAVSGRPTHPYDIHEILLAYQEIDPGYRLLVREPKPKTATEAGGSA